MNAIQRALKTTLTRIASWASVSLVPVGLPNDGVNLPLFNTGPADIPPADLRQQQLDSLEAYRTNPMARRLIQLAAVSVIGDGITISSPYKPLNSFIAEFWGHEDNLILMRELELCIELSRAGELYPVLFPEPLSVPRLRAIPATDIESITWRDGDYETETGYRQISVTPESLQPVIWKSKHTAQPGDPLMLHFPVNRPIGALRGESDLATILPWLRRYARWLEDRVRLNAASRAYIWLVNAPNRLHNDIRNRYASEPQPGTVIVADENEKWTSVAPNLNARDAASDGRAIRWMIAAGGPGTGLLDLGEGEDSNQATGKVMTEQRRRFLMQRQDYFAHILVSITLHAWRMHSASTRRRYRPVTLADIEIAKPDISPEDNATLAAAANDITAAIRTMAAYLNPGQTLRRLILRLFSRFTQETLTPVEIDELTKDTPDTPTPTAQPQPAHQGGAEEEPEETTEDEPE